MLSEAFPKFRSVEVVSRYWEDLKALQRIASDQMRPLKNVVPSGPSDDASELLVNEHWRWRGPSQARIEETMVQTHGTVPTLIIRDGTRRWSQHASDVPITNHPEWSHLFNARLAPFGGGASEEVDEWLFLGWSTLKASFAWHEAGRIQLLSRAGVVYDALAVPDHHLHTHDLQPWFPGADRYTVVVDERYGVVLKSMAWCGERMVSAWEVTSVVFNPELPSTLFSPP